MRDGAMCPSLLATDIRHAVIQLFAGCLLQRIRSIGYQVPANLPEENPAKPLFHGPFSFQGDRLGIVEANYGGAVGRKCPGVFCFIVPTAGPPLILDQFRDVVVPAAPRSALRGILRGSVGL